MKLLWAALMVEAEAAERAGARRSTTSRARRCRRASRARSRGPDSGPRARATPRSPRPELTRIERTPDPGAWLAAAAGFDEIALPWPAAYARLRAAEAFVAAGDRAAAAEPLAAALRGGRGDGGAPLAEAGRALARARARADRGGPRRSRSRAAPLGLTPREHEVLLLVAEGHTNREIGEQLFMSEKTASVHVSRILAKLDVGGRVEAAAVAHRLGLTAKSR